MAKILFNEDPNHFIVTRARAGVEVTKKEIVDFIMQYQNTQITDFMLCLNASLTFYNSKKTMSAIDKYKLWEKEGKLDGERKDIIIEPSKLLIDIYEKQGLEMHKIWIDTLRSIGIHPWASIRMNDIHDTDQTDAFLWSDFYKANRHLTRASHRGPANYYENGLDYLYQEVRDHYMTVIEEALETFDVDGLELDWMREIYSVGIGREYEGIAVINAFMREVFARVKEAEKRWGHPIKIGVRLPDTPEKCLRLGFDFFDWVEAGIVDLIVVTPRWSSVDNNMPIDLWHRILKGKNVELAAGLEILLDAYNRRGRKYLNNTFETAIGSACAYLSMGADAIYFFNYMDETVPDKSVGRAVFADPETYRKLLTTAGDLDKAKNETRRHVVTYDDVYAVGAPGAKQLPINIGGTRDHVTGFSALRIPTGPIPAGRRVTVVLGFAKEPFNVEDVTVYLNAKKCKLVGTAEPVHPQYLDMDYYVFEAENDGNLPPVSVCEVGLAEGRISVHWAEVDIT